MTPALLDLIGQTRTVFVAWVEYLKTGHGNPPDATGMLAAAELLRLGSEAAEPQQISDVLVQPVGSAAEATGAPLPAAASMLADGELQATEDDRKTRSRLSLAADLAEIFNAEAGAHLATLQREF